MKKLITILFMFSFLANAQNWKIDFTQQDKQTHFAAGFFTGVVFNDLTYTVLKDTKLNIWWAKGISFSVGAGAGILLGHLKEKYDKKHGGIYNRKDFNATLLGGIGGSITLRFALWGSIPLSKVPKGAEVWDSREMKSGFIKD